MLSLPGLSQVSTTWWWEAVAERFLGSPGGSAGSAAATAAVAALVSDSSLPASSVKETLTLMALPSSLLERV